MINTKSKKPWSVSHLKRRGLFAGFLGCSEKSLISLTLKKTGIIILSLFIIFNIIWFFSYERFNYFPNAFVSLRNLFFSSSLYKTATAIGTILFSIEGAIIPGITLTSPENTTYNFSIGDSNYTLWINVTANFDVNTWWFRLTDLKHNTIINNTAIFTPNTTFNAARWSNELIVFANDSLNRIVNDSVIFSVYVPNSAPNISGIPNEIYRCENSYLSHYFNVTDVDEDTLIFSIVPQNPFYVIPVFSIGLNLTVIELVSGTLSKRNTGIHQEVISVSDGEFADQVQTNITVIAVNNEPGLGFIGAKTVWSQGDNSTFYYQLSVSDTEDGSQNSGNFTINLSFLQGERFFGINNYGVMNFSANSSLIGVWNLSVCVKDNGLLNPHPNISLCDQTGSNITSCVNFSLTVTNQNRAPYLVSYYNTGLNLSAAGTEAIYFNISKYDPDGTYPDSYWYVDDSLREIYSGSLIDEYNYVFGCGVSGQHTVRVDVTDGELNDSVQWNITVSKVSCAVPSAQGGGGGGGVTGCTEKWACEDWKTCQNLESSFKLNLIAKEDYEWIKKLCNFYSWDERRCGYQIKICLDLKSCNTTYIRPSLLQDCEYTEEPSCVDGLKNCHDGSCEILVDCGGPCEMCATCSDKKQNQGEEGIDCGGPCPPCPVEVPAKKKNLLFLFVLIFAVLILAIYIICKYYRIIKIKKRLEEYEYKKRNKV